MPDIILEDQSLRDGLQSEKKVLALTDKQDLFHLLVAAGFTHIQAGSFVNPKRVPQMADCDQLFPQLIEQHPDLVISGLVLNTNGLKRALKSGLRHVCLSASISDTHSRKNVGKSAHEALAEMIGLIQQAVTAGLNVRAGVQCAFGCVYEGAISETVVIEALNQMTAAGAHAVNVADTTGMAHPDQVRRLIPKIKQQIGAIPISLHLHDTQCRGLANMQAGFEAGIRHFDVAAGGLGGCPFVKGAAGNVAAEKATSLFKQIGQTTGINPVVLTDVVSLFEKLLGRRLNPI
jgi:hydroxymethylglutaryl-CoA lyase